MRGVNVHGKQPSDYLQHHPFYSLSEQSHRSNHNRSVQQVSPSTSSSAQAVVKGVAPLHVSLIQGVNPRKPIVLAEQYSTSPYNYVRPPTYNHQPSPSTQQQHPYSAMFGIRAEQAQHISPAYPTTSKPSSHYSFNDGQSSKRQTVGQPYPGIQSSLNSRSIQQQQQQYPQHQQPSPYLNGNRSYQHENSMQQMNGGGGSGLPKLDNSSAAANNSLYSSDYLLHTSMQQQDQKVLKAALDAKREAAVGPRNHLRNIVKYSQQNSGGDTAPSGLQIDSTHTDRRSYGNAAIGVSTSTNNANGSSQKQLYQRPPTNNKDYISNTQLQQTVIPKSISFPGKLPSHIGQDSKVPRRISNQNMLSNNTTLPQMHYFSAAATGTTSRHNSSTNAAQSHNASTQQNSEQLLDPRMMPKIDKSKISTKAIGVVQAYAANTHQGLVRGYNEDRVSIILNMVKPPEKKNVTNWPNVSYFAIYDGHGGANCADFLRDCLHLYVTAEVIDE